MSMSIEQARNVYSQYVRFAQEELAKAGNNLDDAKGVASFVAGNEQDDSDCRVVRSDTDSIHRWWRGSADRASNVNAREKFFEAIETLLDKKAVKELQGHIQGEVNFGTDSSRPLSARRIIRISREVDLALMGTKDGNPLKNLVEKFGEDHQAFLTGFATGQVEMNMEAAVRNFRQTFAGMLDKVEFFADVKQKVEGELANFDAIFTKATSASGDKAAALKTMLVDFDTAVRALRVKIDGQNLPDSRERSALYGVLVTLEWLNGDAQKGRYLLDVPRLRPLVDEAKAALDDAKNGGVPDARLKSIGDQLTDEKLMRGELREEAIKELKQKAVILQQFGQTLSEIENKKADVLQPCKDAIDALVNKALNTEVVEPGAVDTLKADVDEIVKFNQAMVEAEKSKDAILPPYRDFVDRFALDDLKAGKVDENAVKELKDRVSRLVKFNKPVEILQEDGKGAPVSFLAFIETQTRTKIASGDLSDEALGALMTMAKKLVAFSKAMVALETAKGVVREGVKPLVEQDLQNKANAEVAVGLDDKAIQDLANKAELLKKITEVGAELDRCSQYSAFHGPEFADYINNLADKALCAGSIDQQTLDDLETKAKKLDGFCNALYLLNRNAKSRQVKVPDSYIKAHVDPLFEARPDTIIALEIGEIRKLQSQARGIGTDYDKAVKQAEADCGKHVQDSIRRVQDRLATKLAGGLTNELKRMLFLDSNAEGSFLGRWQYSCYNRALQDLNGGLKPRMLSSTLIEKAYARECAEKAMTDINGKFSQLRYNLKMLTQQVSAKGGKVPTVFAEVSRALEADEKAFNENVKLVGVADLASLGNAWQAIEGKYAFLVKRNPNEPLKLSSIKPDGDIRVKLAVKPQFNLDNRVAFVDHELDRRLSDIKAIVNNAEGLDRNVRDELLARIDGWFSVFDDLPKKLVDMGVGKCSMARNETEASRIVRKFFNNYFSCLVEQAVTNGRVEYGEDGLPTIDVQTVDDFAAKRLRIVDNDLSLSAFGHADKIDHALRLLGKLKSSEPMAADLEQALKRAKDLFAGPPEAKSYDNEKFDETYRGMFKARLDEQDAELGGVSRRQYLTDLLEDLECVVNAGKSAETKAMVLGNCKKFAGLAISLSAGLSEKAYRKTCEELGGKLNVLVNVFPKVGGVKGATDPTLNPKRLQELFMDRMGLDDAGWNALTEKDVNDMLPHLKLVLEHKDDSYQFAAFLKGVGEKELPLSLLKRDKDKEHPDLKAYDNTRLLHELVYLKVLDDLGSRLQICDGKFEVGVGTVSGKEILCGLAMDGLQELPYMDVGDPKYPPTKKVLSLLWSMNGKKFGGLPELCRRTFGCEISKVEMKDCEAACAKMRANLEDKNDLPLLAGLDPLLDLAQKNPNAKSLMRMLDGDVTCAFTSWKGKPDFNSVKGWIDSLRLLAAGKVKSVNLTMNGVPVRFAVTSAGYTTVEFPDPTTKKFNPSRPLVMWLGQTPGALASSLADMALRAPTGYYNGTMLQTLLPSADDPAARGMALAVLTSRTHSYTSGWFLMSETVSARVRTADLSDMSTAELLKMAGEALRGGGKELVERLQNRSLATAPDVVNSQGILDVLARLDAAEKKSQSEVDRVVQMPPAAKPDVSPAEAARQRAHGFVADLLASAESWTTDGLDATARIRLAVTRHATEVAELLQAGDENAIKSKLSTLGTENLAAAAAKLLAGLQKHLGAKEPAAKDLGAAFDAWNRAVEGGALRLLTEATKKDMAGLQAIFVKEVEQSIVSTETVSVGLQSLHELAGTASVNKTDRGYGEFLTNVLKNYFTGMGDFDKMRMLANVVRGTRAGMDSMDRVALLVQGAGPIFLKMLQGIPEGAIPKGREKLRKLLGDVKDKLPPMPDRVIKAQLYDMVARSDGKISGIEVVKSLGAASVGQALLCRVRTAANPDGEECVVKLLRPEAQNSVRREMTFFKEQMAKVPGMDKTFQSRLDTILDELDLAREAVNVETGLGSYRDVSGRVSTMELHSVIRPTETSLVVKKARGVTCDKYFRRVGEQMNEILANLRRTDKVTLPDGGVRTVTRYRAANMTECNAQRDKLFKLYLQTYRRQQDLVSMIGMWAEQAVFGTGFFHGDLHAGNIMMDESGVTLIDYGNAVGQTKAEREWLVKLLTLSSYSNAMNFVDQFKDIPKKSADALRKDMEDAFVKGTMNDSALRVATAVNLLQRHGVPVPPNLYNFTQSMLRLQEALNLANDTLAEIKNVFLNVGVDAKTPEEIEQEDPFDLGTHDFLSLIEKDGFKTKGEVLVRQLEETVDDNATKMRQGRKTLLEKLKALSESKEKVRDELLPLLEKHAMFHTVKMSIESVRDNRDDLGMRAYRLAKEMLDDSFDFNNELDRLNRIKTIHELIVKRAKATAKNAVALDRETQVDSLETFSEVLSSCIGRHDKDIMAIMGARYAIHIGKVMSAGYEASAEVVAQKWVGEINRSFQARHPAFSPTIVVKISNLVRDEFAYEKSVFTPGWHRYAGSTTRMAEILLANVRRVKQLLVREEGYRPEEDKNGTYLRQALTLAFAHYANRHSSPKLDIFSIFAAANREKYFDPWLNGFETGASFGGGVKRPDMDEVELLKFVCNLLHNQNARSPELSFLPSPERSAELFKTWLEDV